MEEIVRISIEEKIDPAKVEAALSKSKTLSSITGKMAMGSEILAFLGIVLSADSSGATIKFSQFSKLLSRLRYINLNYGYFFGSFLTGLGQSFDGKLSEELDTDIKNKSKEEILKAVKIYRLKQEFVRLLSNGHKGKFNKYGIDLFLIGKNRKDFITRKIQARRIELNQNDKAYRILQGSSTLKKAEIDRGFDWGRFLDELKFYLYMISWLNLGICGIIKYRSYIKKSISAKLVKFISISQKVHFLLFNLVCVDIAFIGTRTLVHAQYTPGNTFLLIWTGLIYTLLILDVMDIANLQLSIKYEIFTILRGDKVK